MNIALFEQIITPGGHELEFDRIIIEELKSLGHSVTLYLPANAAPLYDYKIPVKHLPGEGISYAGVSKFAKLWLTAKREINRCRWFNTLHRLALAGEFDAIIIPTATYRYLRSLNLTRLKQSLVPVIFVVHGVNPGEAPMFFRYAEKMVRYPNIKIIVLTLGKNLFEHSLPNVSCIHPPAYTPRDIRWQPCVAQGRPLKIGFFGQYRKEKNLEFFLNAFVSAKFKFPVRLLVQGAAFKPEDAVEFNRIMEKYRSYEQIEFCSRGLVGAEWQQAVAGVDAIVMPYTAERYRYHWSGMLFTAIGYYKPFIAADCINPEILENYNIGCSFAAGNADSLKMELEKFVNTYYDKAEFYQHEFCRANEVFAPEVFVRNLLKAGGVLAKI
ncbi:hypothetical protein TcarDRAFT_1315 [Thermosinus carboxydivorans Nor1]|uniref:Glycosyl transferase, group 1 n=1 Tax=Thermosinus carboxydivorans Nor1 TaxID=401526 RepID=A1HRG5_9FIRM|nr:hypothetical protein TcarDRAFT_1315 [Thermosinus carboxydivorans Nor1]